MKFIEWCADQYISIREAWRNRQIKFEITVGEILFCAAVLYLYFRRG